MVRSPIEIVLALTASGFRRWLLMDGGVRIGFAFAFDYR